MAPPRSLSLLLLAVPLLLPGCPAASDDDDSGDDDDAADDDDATDDDDAADDDDATAAPDAYPSERGFEFDGAWYPSATIQPCGSNGDNLSTYSVGPRTGSGENAIAAWLFGAPPPPGQYTTSPYDGATGPTEADFVLTDTRDNAQWLSTGVSGTVTVYSAENNAIDVVWHNVSLATVFAVPGSSAEGWVTCTL